jgi:hypothetical protein
VRMELVAKARMDPSPRGMLSTRGRIALFWHCKKHDVAARYRDVPWEMGVPVSAPECPMCEMEVANGKAGEGGGGA